MLSLSHRHRVSEARSHFNPLEHPRVRTGELAAEGPLAEFVDFFATEEDVMRGGLVRSVRSALERGSMTTGSQRAGTAANDLAALASTSGSAVRTEVKEPEGDGKVLYVATRGTIELIEWEYYWGIHSAQIDSDEYFERLLFGVWKEINLEAKTRARDAWAAEVPNMSRPSTPVSALASAGTRGSRDEVKRSIDGAIAGAAARSHSRAGSKMLLAEENEPEQDGHKHLYDFETRRRLAQRLRRMSYIISDPRTYRHALDIALLPITPPVVFSAETSLVKSTVHQILSNLYTLFPSPPSISSEASSRPSKPLNGVSSSGLDLRGPAAPHTAFSPSLDPATFEQVWRRCKRDVEKVTTASELEWVCRETLLKEVGFAEYLIFARTVKRE
ncbi:hypothetical protein M427DRAFT_198621 [Gonapodya prolifera JEL478]|uniref:Uncharacterized protein n=1 Tax=Gonapodya prolifera (strain JEL478) TaxID=1344416 RepID=A0A139APR2_GONPJ|nr:hypothetical protein M427DRAFT_198621 [Gonapodya prolifera JEL478]|eukprot:KXS18741.1 hypothetical protein M427DRAFT_198621 [Gonapodya prolifera JEL478]